MIRRISEPLRELANASICQVALRIRLAIKNLQRQQFILVRLDELAKARRALLGLAQIIASARDLIDCPFVDDDIGFLFDDLDAGCGDWHREESGLQARSFSSSSMARTCDFGGGFGMAVSARRSRRSITSGLIGFE